MDEPIVHQLISEPGSTEPSSYQLPGTRSEADSEETNNDGSPHIGSGEQEESQDPDPDPTDGEVSLFALTGVSHPATLRFSVQLQQETMVALVDSGSSHNFVNRDTAKELLLTPTPIPPFSVKVANGDVLCCEHCYEDVELRIQGELMRVDLYELPIKGLDVVLGIHWLRQLGPVTIDWNRLTLKFMDDNDRWVELQGIRKTIVKDDHLHQLRRREVAFWPLCVPDQGVASTESPAELQELLGRYADLFESPTQLPPHRIADHRIPLKEGTDEINMRPYRYAHYQKEEIERQVGDMLRTGLIQPSSSPISSPVLLVKKKDGTWRFCTDFRALNQATIKDRFPIPTVDDMLDELHDARYLTKLDLRAGYHQIRMSKEDIPKTAFQTHSGHYEYVVMPFGLCNAPATFQAAMNDIFRHLLRKSVLVFFYDILIYSRDWETHLQHLQEVFGILRSHQYYLNHAKCVFGRQRVEYLGHIITPERVQVDNSKIQAMVDGPSPRNVSELRGFLGLTGYYRKFVQNYSSIARPSTLLLKKGGFDWTEAAEQAFIRLKRAMTSTPTLAMPDFTKPFTIEADASR
ncbi:unnamed protein product [Linum trigynum]|uniref:Reverse transcriptase domain-containing protein n=1 Tax=Linum trigynum TaxID=586398 RepID=A0AAV2CK07_9ROSI